MSTCVLPSDTLLSTLLPSGGGSLASGDTIDFNGHTLVMDCDAVAYPFTPANAGGVPCKLELRDLSRIRLNASLPSTVSPWVDPEHPLPVSTPGVAEGVDGYITGLTANARAEIQLAGNFSLGGGAANLPTEIRPGNWFGKAAAYPTSTSVIFDRDMTIHAGDCLLNFLSANEKTMSRFVTAYNPETRTATLNAAWSTNATGAFVAVAAGGVCVRAVVSRNAPLFVAPVSFGQMTVLGSSRDWSLFNGVVAVGHRLSGCSFLEGWSLSDFATGDASIAIDEVAWDYLSRNNSGFPFYGTLAVGTLLTPQKTLNQISHLKAQIGLLLAPTLTLPSISKDHYGDIGGGEITGVGTPSSRCAWYRLRGCTTVGGNLLNDTICVLQSGTVSRVARSDFPTDTDLPDAFYFAPATASDVPWRYEDHWVRKGETLRLSCRAMRGGDNGTARVAIGEMAVWVPAAGMPTLAEWVLDSGEPLAWRGGQIAWTNDTDEDCQVRVWSMASGIHGAYIRVWRATGGAL